MEKPDFAKLFNCPVNGQILAKLDVNDDDQYIVEFFGKPKGLGLCSSIITLDKDAPDDKVQEYFDSLDLKAAQAMTEDLFELGDSISEQLAN